MKRITAVILRLVLVGAVITEVNVKNTGETFDIRIISGNTSISHYIVPITTELEKQFNSLIKSIQGWGVSE